MPPHPHDAGLQHDLERLLTASQHNRRKALRWLALGSVAPVTLMACGGSDDDVATTSSDTASTTTGSSDTSGSGTTTTTDTSTCSVIPEETAGPYPGDGSNSNSNGLANALALSGIVRQDMRSSIAGASGVADGIALTIKLKLVSTSQSCAALADHAIYLWHCDQAGRYSMYSQAIIDENYLRAVQATDANGEATFITIVPGCYDGRMPHMHFEIYPSVDQATSAANKLNTSQLTFPLEMLNTVYATSGYETSVSNLARISFATDNIFSDGVATQTCAVSGDTTQGYTATLTIGVPA